MNTTDTRPLAERLPKPGKVVMTASQSALKRQIEREAMETARETGRTPRQLADDRAELIAALSDMLRSADAGDLDSLANASDTARELLTRLNS